MGPTLLLSCRRHCFTLASHFALPSWLHLLACWPAASITIALRPRLRPQKRVYGWRWTVLHSARQDLQRRGEEQDGKRVRRRAKRSYASRGATPDTAASQDAGRSITGGWELSEIVHSVLVLITALSYLAKTRKRDVSGELRMPLRICYAKTVATIETASQQAPGRGNRLVGHPPRQKCLLPNSFYTLLIPLARLPGLPFRSTSKEESSSECPLSRQLSQ